VHKDSELGADDGMQAANSARQRDRRMGRPVFFPVRYTANDLDLPDNISLLFLPPYSPELNPIENLFQFLRHNFLNARVYDTYVDIVDACCWAWTTLLNIEGQLKSITTRSWAKTVNR